MTAGAAAAAAGAQQGSSVARCLSHELRNAAGGHLFKRVENLADGVVADGAQVKSMERSSRRRGAVGDMVERVLRVSAIPIRPADPGQGGVDLAHVVARRVHGTRGGRARARGFGITLQPHAMTRHGGGDVDR